MKISIIDIGTQSIKHYIFETKGGNKKLYYKRYSEANLGENETISPQTMDRNVAILKQCMDLNDKEGVEKLQILGTDILRKADNAGAFLSSVKDLFDVEIKIISHEDEARYLYEGFLSIMPTDSDFAAENIGGGSTEIVTGNLKEMKSLNQVPFGVKFLRKSFASGDAIDWKKMAEYVSAEMSISGSAPIIFVTGIDLDFITTVAPHLGFSFEDNDMPHHPVKFPFHQYENFVKKLQMTPISELKEHFTKDPIYCENVAIGHTVYLEGARKLKAEWVIPSNNDLTDGIIHELLKK